MGALAVKEREGGSPLLCAEGTTSSLLRGVRGERRARREKGPKRGRSID